MSFVSRSLHAPLKRAQSLIIKMFWPTNILFFCLLNCYNRGLCALRHRIQKFNGRNFGLPPSSIHEMTELGGKTGVGTDVCAQAQFYIPHPTSKVGCLQPDLTGEFYQEYS